MDQNDRNPLEEAVREIAENAQAARIVRPIVREPLMVRIDRDRKRRRRASVIGIAALLGTAIIFASIGVAALKDSVPKISSSGFSWDMNAGWCCLGPLVPLTLAALCIGIFMQLLPRDARRAARMFSAHLAGSGEVTRARQALADISLTVGLSKAPPLYVMDNTDSLNAYVVGKSVGGCAMGITRAMADTLSLDELRAVFAHLFARVVIGDAAQGQNDEALSVQADAEAMNLLRDPRAMLSALERVLNARTAVATSGSGFVTQHFFAPWIKTPGALEPLTSVINEQAKDRIGRLRAVLGVSGAVD